VSAPQPSSATGPAEGRIRVGITVRDGTVQRVDVTSSRPVSACRIFVGRRPAEVVSMAGMLYSVCGKAQALAALEALEGACGREPAGAAHRLGRGLGVLSEVLREHATRLLVDWPARLGRLNNAAAARGLRSTTTALVALIPGQTTRWCDSAGDGALATGCAGALVHALEMQLAEVLLGHFGLPLARLDDEQGFEDWVAAGDGLAWVPAMMRGAGLSGVGSGDCPPMPPLDAGALSRRLAAGGEGFAARPDWGGTVYETGPLARLWQHPVVAAVRARDGAGALARVIARLLELADIPRQMRRLLEDADAECGSPLRHVPEAGAAVAVLETARGRLAHRVTVEGGRVSGYRTLAPTEWNFHPAGPLVTGLLGACAPDAAVTRRHAELAASALDPCVALDVSTVGA